MPGPADTKSHINSDTIQIVQDCMSLHTRGLETRIEDVQSNMLNMEVRIDKRLNEINVANDQKLDKILTQINTQFENLRQQIVPLSTMTATLKQQTESLNTIVFGEGMQMGSGLRDRVQTLEHTIKTQEPANKELGKLRDEAIAETARRSLCKQIIIWGLSLLGTIATFALGAWELYFKHKAG